MLESTAIDCDYADEILPADEQDYVVSQVRLIAERITNHTQNNSLSEIIGEYFECD